MPNYGAKISSAYISNDLLREFIDALPSVMRDLYGDRSLTAYYGWACNLHSDLLYKPMNVSLDVFPYFIEDSIAQGIFKLGGSDLLIDSPDAKVRIVVCHESDIHLDGTDDESIHKLVVNFPQLDFRTAEQWRAAAQDNSEAANAHDE